MGMKFKRKEYIHDNGWRRDLTNFFLIMLALTIVFILSPGRSKYAPIESFDEREQL